MPTFTVLADAYNYMQKNELADRPEHVTVRRGGTVELDDAERAAMLVEAGILAEGEVNPDEVAAAQQAEEQAAATDTAATDDTESKGKAPSGGRRR